MGKRIAQITCVLSLACLVMAPSTAFATDVEQLTAAYTTAVQTLEDALDEQEQNANEIKVVESDIATTRTNLERMQDALGGAATAWYKGKRSDGALLELILNSESFQDAVFRYDTYERVEHYYADRVDEFVAEKKRLEGELDRLERLRQEIEEKVADAQQAADEAEEALRDAVHDDGAKYHQRQGVSNNCGATSFIVGVNAVLHENRFTDNVAVWSSPSFGCDSTMNIAWKGSQWLLANGLAGEIAIESVPGDIFTTAQMRAQFNQGRVIVISSGGASEWQHADGTTLGSDAHPSGHFVLFYHYADGVYYCNDSSVDAAHGAGCAYTEEQMTQWLNGRGMHDASVIYKKQQ